MGKPTEGARDEARKMLAESDPDRIKILTDRYPELISALESTPVNERETKLAEAIDRIGAKQLEEQKKNRNALRRLEHDPMDIEAQRILEQEIHKQNIHEDFKKAMESNPESFASVTMLYVPMRVNSFSLQAFVDSGAQATIMSMACATRCNLERLIDRKFQGMAKGVGVSKTVGRIHRAEIQLGDAAFEASFLVLEQVDIDVLFGLDLLRKFDCCIDLKNNCLAIGDQRVKFLPEHELLLNGSQRVETRERMSPHHGGAPNRMESNTRGLTDSQALRHNDGVALNEIQKNKLDQLMTALKIDQAKAREALEVTNWDLEQAGAYVFESLV